MTLTRCDAKKIPQDNLDADEAKVKGSHNKADADVKRDTRHCLLGEFKEQRSRREE